LNSLFFESQIRDQSFFFFFLKSEFEIHAFALFILFFSIICE